MAEVRFLREYDFKEVEAKWQKKWVDGNIFRTENSVPGKENYYVLEMLLILLENFMWDMPETILLEMLYLDIKE